MAKETSPEKRPPGRPLGREFTHMARVPMRPETWQRLTEVAAEEGKSAAEIIRGLVSQYLKNRSRN